MAGADGKRLNLNIRWQQRRRRAAAPACIRSFVVVTLVALRSGGSVCKHTAAAVRQLRSSDGGHHIRDRPRHGCSAVRSVLGNRLTRTPGACKWLSFFQSDCHSIRTHLSGRVCTDRPPWGRTLRAPPGSIFPCRFGFAVAIVGYALLTSGKHTKDSIEPSPRPAIFWSVAIVIIVVVCADLGRYGRT